MTAHEDWKWYAGGSEEWMNHGPFDTREEAIKAAREDDDEAFCVLEAKNPPLRLADWIEADEILDRADENLSESDRVMRDHDDGPWFEADANEQRDLQDRLERACDEWQAAHGFVFTCKTFTATRNLEFFSYGGDE